MPPKVVRGKNAALYFHTCERMDEVEDQSAKLVLGAATHLGGWESWKDYLALLETVYRTNLQRVVRPDGYFVLTQTDCFIGGEVMPRGAMLLQKVRKWGWELIDYKVWRRLKANFRQPPWSHVYVMRPPGGTAKRPSPTDTEYFAGVWDYPQTCRGKLNGWPPEFCRMLVRNFTEKGDLIVDPFAGTCMLLGVADQMGRRAVGYEIDPDTVPVIRQNLAADSGGLF